MLFVSFPVGTISIPVDRTLIDFIFLRWKRERVLVPPSPVGNGDGFVCFRLFVSFRPVLLVNYCSRRAGFIGNLPFGCFTMIEYIRRARGFSLVVVMFV